MRRHRTLSLLPFTVFALLLTTLAHADFQAGKDAFDRHDYATALKEWQPLAEQGDAEAQYNLAQMYTRGQGVPKDHAESNRLYRLAAEQGHRESFFYLGVSYQWGRGVPQNYIQAHKWYNVAAAQDWELPILEKIAEVRDTLAKDMTPAQLAEAQRLAREWLGQHQK
jgi:TPR repeat protein